MYNVSDVLFPEVLKQNNESWDWNVQISRKTLFINYEKVKNNVFSFCRMPVSCICLILNISIQNCVNHLDAYKPSILVLNIY